MAIYFALVFGFYFLLMITLWLGWRKATNIKVNASSGNIFISVVVAMRNEKENLENLLQSLVSQNYSPSSFEIIIVDDHSTDDSEGEARKWMNRFPVLTILSLDENKNGKKAALTVGIDQAKGEVIATTDADCILPINWLQRINEGFQDEKTSMLIGAVSLQNQNHFFSQLQSIEFASVIGTGISLCAWGNPTMCNGGNLSFRRRIFEEVDGYSGNEHIASGDDEFLMRKIQDKSPDSIHTLNPIDCMVITKPQVSISDFIRQRLRWASKWKSNSSILAKLLAVFMFVLQASWLALISRMIVDNSIIAMVIVVLKLIVDLFFLASVCVSLKMRFNFLAFTSLQFLYPVYVLFIGSFSQAKNHEWKGRRT